MKKSMVIAVLMGMGLLFGSQTVKAQGGDKEKKAQVESSSESLLAAFIPEKKAEMEAVKAMELQRKSEALLAGSKLAATPNPEGKPNRMMLDSGDRGGNGAPADHKGGNGAPATTGKASRTRSR